MGSNTFGTLFCVTTWGESHGKAIGAVIDGCPAGIALTEDDINAELAKRAPGRSPYTSPRREPDETEILSGVFEGVTTGAPISIMIHNRDADSSKYESIKHLARPGHANTTYLAKYGVFDYRGGGRASARETACRVAAGAIAKKLMARLGTVIEAELVEVGGQREGFESLIEKAKAEGDSLGGVVEFTIRGLPAGLGEPVYRKFESMLAAAMLSIPATKGFEIGEGFEAARMRGSTHNDAFISTGKSATNHAGGTLGGITTGMEVRGRVAIKPTSSIMKPQSTVDLDGKEAEFQLPQGSRHDPCVAIRAVPVVEAMAALVTADALLMTQGSSVRNFDHIMAVAESNC
jgi:chorismate synthase